MQHVFATVVLLCLALTSLGVSQNATAPPDLVEVLTPTIFPVPNEALNSLFPPSIIVAQTPIAVRYVLVTTVPAHDLDAACSPVALSFFGTKDTIPSRFCKSPLSLILILVRMIYRVLIVEFPVEGAQYGRFLIRNGVNPLEQSTDVNTEVGWATTIANRFLRYLRTDGWNSQGDLTKKNYRLQFQDPTGYEPQNKPSLTPERLFRPLRWQPLISSDQHGDFASQIHVVPHIGVSTVPLTLSPDDFKARRAPQLYSTPNRKKSISKVDEDLALRLIQKLFRRSRKTTKKKITRAYYWENKFISLGTFILFYQGVLGFDDSVARVIALGEVIAQYDATLVAWKEKRRHDYVRPPTLIRRLLGGKTVRAFRGVGKGVGPVAADEWQPIVPIQPHSEYPSASATICTASFEHLEIALNQLVLKGNGSLPQYFFDVSGGTLPGNPVEDLIRIKFDTLRGAARSCGRSRLDSGVHFEPSVSAGNRLGKGIGRSAFEHVADLVHGRIPEHCARCIKS